jgi:2-hydroxycyclohexanecarboxyl-CoA dehydrogenase
MTSDKKPTIRSLPDSGVLITGGTAGVGLLTAHHFVAAGVRRIVLLGRDVTRGQAACAAVIERAPGTQAHFLACDAANPDAVQATVAQAAALLGSIDVLVNSTVSPYTPDLLFRTPLHDLPIILTQQALPPMLMCRAVLPYMQAQNGGAIINIASDAAKVPTQGETVLGAAMAAITMFSRTLAMEAKRNGIRVNVLTPSLIEGTGAAERNLADGFSAKLFQKVARLAELGLTQPEDLASLIVYLASPQAARITAQVISVNSGISAG